MGEGQEGIPLWHYGLLPRQDPEIMSRSGWAPENLRKRGFDPKTVIDVGVAGGTPTLYEAFPEAYLALIEPLDVFRPSLEHILATREGEHVPAAVGATEGSATMTVDTEAPWMSSLRSEIHRDTSAFGSKEIPVRTLDALMHERGWEAPFGLKIDTEGFEREVIQGATEVLRYTQFVIAEVSVIRRFEGSYSFAEIVGLLEERNFALYDILDAQKIVPESSILFMDVMFRGFDPANSWAA
jgi:FkbM family methyltransferase